MRYAQQTLASLAVFITHAPLRLPSVSNLHRANAVCESKSFVYDVDRSGPLTRVKNVIQSVA